LNATRSSSARPGRVQRDAVEDFLFVGYTVAVSIISWFKRITGKKDGAKEKRRISVLPHKQSAQDLNLSSLRSEQRDLAQSLGKMIDQAEKSLNEISAALKQSKPHDKQALARIRERQAKIRMALLRFETALQRKQELERELSEWERPQSKGHFDQMRRNIKSELLRSELAMRDLLDGKHKKNETIEADNIKEPISAASQPEKFEMPVGITESKIFRSAPSLRISHEQTNHLEPRTENLIRSIREVSMELSKHEQAPDKDVKELASLAHQIRDLHAILRKVDKKFGKMRDRIALTDGFRHVFQYH